ncbi:hypothetical protein HOLleu_37561 [Holothuria leucospilota]|uniref:Uncharacterized protein n=1 Tax=Holothuria leucospilota TaxID=206669 RepID=A0A9Q1BEL4_HOLLE|nr:hypothetical protein HOLleu_37561 [Holothuria leucospilota]
MRKCLFAVIFLLACAYVGGHRSKQLDWIKRWTQVDCSGCDWSSWKPTDSCPTGCGDDRKRSGQLPLTVEEAEREFDNYLLRRKKMEDFLQRLMEYYYY